VGERDPVFYSNAEPKKKKIRKTEQVLDDEKKPSKKEKEWLEERKGGHLGSQ